MTSKTSFYTREELEQIGFLKIGKNVLISRKASIYAPEMIEIGDNVRIDDFCILSGKIRIGNYVHIAAGCYLFGGEYGIEMEDFSGLSSRVVIYAVTDDYTGKYLTIPTVPREYRNVIGGRVHLGKHVIVGTGATILPGVTIGEGAAIGAMSLVNKDVPPWQIVMGIPAIKISDRRKDLLELEKHYFMKEKGLELTNDTGIQSTSENNADNNFELTRLSIANIQELEAKLLEIAKGIFEKEIALDDKREEISAWDSFAHLLLVTRVEEELGLVIPTEEVSKVRCLKDFLKFAG
ncbi:hypothetical protein [Fervidobacterium sp.]